MVSALLWRTSYVQEGVRGSVGVNLRDLFPQHPVDPTWYHGKRIAVDGHNVAFRYLTTMRSRDGDFLRSPDGRVTSHLYGFAGLVRQLRMAGAEPILIWDGDIHPRKMATVQSRIDARQKAEEAAQAAKDAGDHVTFQRLVRQTVYVTRQMIDDATRMMDALGVAVVRADHDGERYAAALCHAGHADAVATEDYDALVAGAPYVLRKAGGAEPFLHDIRDLEAHELSLEQLRELAIVCGTDWHPGVKGMGPKTAAKFLREYGSLSPLFDEAAAGDLSTRAHKLLAASDLDRTAFEELSTYIATLPEPPAPRAARSCPDMAHAFASDMGISTDRIVSALC